MCGVVEGAGAWVCGVEEGAGAWERGEGGRGCVGARLQPADEGANHGEDHEHAVEVEHLTEALRARAGWEALTREEGGRERREEEGGRGETLAAG